jgi:type 1 fimbriae regulatory protein FimB/type 1 fimbriae regulatory protein FimE
MPPFPIHPHMLRHSCGYKLVNEDRPLRGIQSYLGHKTVAMTLVYTSWDPRKFAGWFN